MVGLRPTCPAGSLALAPPGATGRSPHGAQAATRLMVGLRPTCPAGSLALAPPGSTGRSTHGDPSSTNLAHMGAFQSRGAPPSPTCWCESQVLVRVARAGRPNTTDSDRHHRLGPTSPTR